MDCFIANGVKVVKVDESLCPRSLKFPTGKKDGNKLGKRKRTMEVVDGFMFNGMCGLPESLYNKLLLELKGNETK
jgi:hypothetical protein